MSKKVFPLKWQYARNIRLLLIVPIVLVLWLAYTSYKQFSIEKSIYELKVPTVNQADSEKRAIHVAEFQKPVVPLQDEQKQQMAKQADLQQQVEAVKLQKERQEQKEAELQRREQALEKEKQRLSAKDKELKRRERTMKEKQPPVARETVAERQPQANTPPQDERYSGREKATPDVGGDIITEMDYDDRDHFFNHALENLAPGYGFSWMNRTSRLKYTVTPYDYYEIESGNGDVLTCRKALVVVESDTAGPRNMTIPACRNGNGSWEITPAE